MKIQEIFPLSISQLSAAFVRKELSPLEVVRAILERIPEINPRLNAFITITQEEALQAAKDAEAKFLAGKVLSPLQGVPIAHKDILYTRGIRTTAASKVYADFVPSYDATVVERLRAAGTILIGKTNLHEIAFGPTSATSYYGPVRNPWNLEHVPGGSSGGSAAVVLTGLSWGATGTDTGGSIRIPAALCGIAGIKPTYGRVSRYGVMPLAWSLDHIGPITRSVEDAAILLEAMAGYDPNDPTTHQLPVPHYAQALTGDIKGLRVGIPKEYFFESADEEVAETVRKAIAVLEGLGARCEEVSLPHMKYAPLIRGAIIFGEASAVHEKAIRTRRKDFSLDIQTKLTLGTTVSAKDYIQAQRMRRLLIGDFLNAFQYIDVVITPTLPIVAPKIGQETVKVRGVDMDLPNPMILCTFPFNATGLPAISVPCGVSASGLPIGLQIAGKPFEESTILKVAHAYEQQTPWRVKKVMGNKW